MLAALDTDGAGIRSGYNYWYSNSLLAYDRGSFNPSHTFFQYGYGTLSSDLVAAYDDVGNRTELTAVLDTSGVPEPAYQNRYGYDRLYRMTSVTQSFVPHSGNPQIPATLALAVAPKRIDFQYDPASQLEQLTRFEDLAGTELVAQSAFVFDAASRLTDMTHSQGATVFADYDWDYDAGNRLEQFVSLADGTVDYNYDDRSQLTGADYTGANLPADESYTYDANGNRELANGAAYQTDPNNRLFDDGTYTYEYDDEGNLTKRTTISDGSYIDYTWDHRNRLTQIGERTSAGGTVKDVHYTYDAFDRRIAKAIVEPGQPTDNLVFVYDGEHIAMALRYDDVSQEYELANRYLHGPSVDMILADEQVTDASQEGNVLWPLTDNLGSVRDIADYDAASDVTTITNHLVYDSFGNIASETNAAIDHIFGYTGRERDQESDLHYNRARYYDPRTARFVSEDPIGFLGGDANLHRYVGNSSTNASDPRGLLGRPGSYLWYLTNPSRMDPGIRYTFYGALGVSAVAGAAAGGVVAAGYGSVTVGQAAAATHAVGSQVAAGASVTATAAAQSPTAHALLEGAVEAAAGVDGPGSGVADAVSQVDEVVEHGSKLIREIYSESGEFIGERVIREGDAIVDDLAEAGSRVAPKRAPGIRGVAGALDETAETALLRGHADNLARFLKQTQANSRRGPVLSVLRDRVTGEVFHAQNLSDIPSNLHPLLASRLEQHLAANAGRLNPVWGIPGSHSEIWALNQALLRREALGLGAQSLDDFALYNVSLWSNRLGSVVPRCGNCSFLTDGVRVLSEN